MPTTSESPGSLRASRSGIIAIRAFATSGFPNQNLRSSRSTRNGNGRSPTDTRVWQEVVAVRVERADDQHQCEDRSRAAHHRPPNGRSAAARSTQRPADDVRDECRQERPRHHRHPGEVCRVGSLEGLREDPEAEHAGDEQRVDLRVRTVTAPQPPCAGRHRDRDDDHREEPEEQLMVRGGCRNRPVRRDRLRDRLQRTVDLSERRWTRQLSPRAQPHDRIDDDPVDDRAGSGDARCTHIGIRPDDGTDQHGTHRRTAMRPSGGEERERHCDDDVGSERQCEPAEQAGGRPRPYGAGVPGPDCEDRRPQGECDRTVPREGGEADRGHREQCGNDAGPDRSRSTPRPGQRVQREHDAEVLEEAEGSLRLERVAERRRTSRRARGASPVRTGAGSRRSGPGPAARGAGRRA